MPEGRGDHPRTLLEWRMADVGEYDTVRHLWVPYEKAFLERGYELFVDGPGFLHCMYGPRDEAQRRAPDGYHQLIDPTQPERRVRYENNSNKCCPATRLSDGAHVMIHITRLGPGEEGKTEQEILRYFSKPELASHPDNHVIPLLDEIQHVNACFAVTPLLHDGLMTPWFHDVGEILHGLSQTSKCLDFLHSHLTAHLDLGFCDILMNYGGTIDCAEFEKAQEKPLDNSFRSLFKPRYYLIDFEMARKFDPSSDPASRVVQGLPYAELRGSADPSKYGKILPPEWVQETPYCPFKSDVCQLGGIWLLFLQHALPILPEVAVLLEKMSNKDPQERLSAAEAYVIIERLRQGMSAVTLSLGIKASF